MTLCREHNILWREYCPLCKPGGIDPENPPTEPPSEGTPK